MSLKTDLELEVKNIFAEAFVTRDGQKVPDTDDLKLNNDAIKLTGTVLYADISDSTKLVDGYNHHFSAEVYKSFLRCAAKIIRGEGGTITAFDGDRVMAVFIGDSKNSTAARVGLKIHWAVDKLINPAVKKQYPNTTFQLNHTVGIDTSEIFIVRGGIRGSNDLLWISNAANHAAKLGTLSHDTPTWITEAVYNGLNEKSKFSNGTNMWQKRSWTQMGGKTVYCSTYRWSLD